MNSMLSHPWLGWTIFRQRCTLRQRQLQGDPINRLQPATRAATHLRDVSVSPPQPARLVWLLGLSLCFSGGSSAVSPGGELLVCALVLPCKPATSCNPVAPTFSPHRIVLLFALPALHNSRLRIKLDTSFSWTRAKNKKSYNDDDNDNDNDNSCSCNCGCSCNCNCTAVVGEARPLGIAQYGTTTESEVELSSKLHVRGPELVARPIQPLLQSQILLLKLGLSGLRSAAPRQNLHSQCSPVKLGRLGPVRVARPELSKCPRSRVRETSRFSLSGP